MYEAVKNASGALDAAKPIDVYWLDIDPAYVAAARKKGVMTDKQPVSRTEGTRRCRLQGKEEGGVRENGWTMMNRTASDWIHPDAVSAACPCLFQLNMVENQFAYGVSFDAVAGKAGTYNLKLVALPERPVTMFMDAEGKLHGTIAVNGKQVDLVRIYVHAVDRTLRLPKVEYIDLVGQDETGAYVHERIVPK